jgi:hypothetical protein
LTGVFLSLGLALGLFIDAIRYLVIRFLCFFPSVKKRHCFLPFPKKDQIEEFNWIIENYYRYHQFYANLAIASALLFFIPDKVPVRLTALVTSALTLAAFFAYLRTVDALNKAFPTK